MAHTPHTWNDGDVVSATVLNTIETDLAVAADAGTVAAAAAAAESYSVQRANHTGTQTADTIVDGATNKVYTATEQTKLAGIAAGATVNRADSATDAAISTAVANLINGAPGALDTLNELATALGDDATFSASVTNALALKAPLDSPTFTGTVGGIDAGVNAILTNPASASATSLAAMYATKTQAIGAAAGLAIVFGG